MKIKNVFKRALVILMALCLIMPAFKAPANAAVKKTKAISVTLKTGQSIKLTLANNKGKRSKAKWTSSNKKIATVSKAGRVKAKKAGVCIIKARYKRTTYKCQVIVKKRKIKSSTSTPATPKPSVIPDSGDEDSEDGDDTDSSHDDSDDYDDVGGDYDDSDDYDDVDSSDDDSDDYDDADSSDDDSDDYDDADSGYDDSDDYDDADSGYDDSDDYDDTDSGYDGIYDYIGRD